MRRFGMVAVLALLAGCNDGMGECETDLDCIDAWDCTTDVCGSGGVCRNTPVDAVCDTGETCDPAMGCVDGGTGECASNEECDDGVMCTNDVCGVGGECMNMPLDERCVMGEVCDTTMGCITDTGCDSAADCDDEIACTNDTCGADRTCNNTPVNEMCDTTMMEQCVPGMGCRVIIPCTNDDDCQDGDFCNGRELCNAEFGCQMPDAPRVCDDSDDCTIDSCDPTAMGSAGQMGACLFECDPSMMGCGCDPPPASCNGTFVVTPAISENCALGQVNYNISQLTFNNTGGVLTVTPLASHFGDLTDTVAPVCPEFEATAFVPGMTPENYRLAGMFTDEDNFVGTWTTDLPASTPPPLMIPTGCTTGGTMMITGTRM